MTNRNRNPNCTDRNKYFTLHFRGVPVEGSPLQQKLETTYGAKCDWCHDKRLDVTIPRVIRRYYSTSQVIALAFLFLFVTAAQYELYQQQQTPWHVAQRLSRVVLAPSPSRSTPVHGSEPPVQSPTTPTQPPAANPTDSGFELGPEDVVEFPSV